MEKRSDEELLAEHLSGRSGAFEQLVDRYTDELYGFLLRYVGNSATADDLIQETFLQVHLAAGSFDPGRTFRPWLYTIAANKARDWLRGRGRRTEQSLDARAGDDSGLSAGQFIEANEQSAHQQADAAEVRDTVRRLIAKMPEHLQLILVLGYYQQLPYVEIADILGIPVGTVKSRLHAAVTRFAHLWREHTRAATTADRQKRG